MEKETVNYHTKKSPTEARELLQVDSLQKSRQNDLSLHGSRDSVILMGQGKSFKNIKRNYEGWYTWSLSMLTLIGTMLCTHSECWLVDPSTL